MNDVSDHGATSLLNYAPPIRVCGTVKYIASGSHYVKRSRNRCIQKDLTDLPCAVVESTDRPDVVELTFDSGPLEFKSIGVSIVELEVPEIPASEI